jgi:uncharacterized membrane protein YgaE (UPF0421/DUF939 family)
MEFIKTEVPSLQDIDFPNVTASPAPPAPYFLSYEYQVIQEELTKLNNKIDNILKLFEKKRPRSTISEANKKLDDILLHMDKKPKLEQ